MEMYEIIMTVFMIVIFFIQAVYVLCNYVNFKLLIKKMKDDNEKITTYNEGVMLFFIINVVLSTVLITMYIYVEQVTTIAVCVCVLSLSSTLMRYIFVIGDKSFYTQSHRVFYSDIKDVKKVGIKNGVLMLEGNKKLKVPNLFKNTFLISAIEERNPEIIIQPN